MKIRNIIVSDQGMELKNFAGKFYQRGSVQERPLKILKSTSNF